MDLDIDDEKSLRCLSEGGGAVKTLAATPLQLAHNLINNTDSGVHSQQSLKSVKIEILQPEVKELLSTCAQYNLENVRKNGDSSSNNKVDRSSAEVLEEIRCAEAIQTLQRAKLEAVRQHFSFLF
jgi:hypothetical protein